MMSSGDQIVSSSGTNGAAVTAAAIAQLAKISNDFDETGR